MEYVDPPGTQTRRFVEKSAHSRAVFKKSHTEIRKSQTGRPSYRTYGPRIRNVTQFEAHVVPDF